MLSLFCEIVQKLIPRSRIEQGVTMLSWMVSVPDYTAPIAAPAAGTATASPSINAMGGLFTWLGHRTRRSSQR